MSHKVFIAKTNLENRLNRGELVVAYNLDELVEHDEFAKLNALLELSHDSFYHVGFKMGETLTSIKYLLPNCRVGGCEIEDLYTSYSNKVLQNKDLGIKFQTKNFTNEPTDEQYEVVFCDGILGNYGLDVQKRIVDNMLKSTTKYVVVMEKVTADLIGYIKYLGHTVENNDEMTVIVKVVKNITPVKEVVKDVDRETE